MAEKKEVRKSISRTQIYASYSKRKNKEALKQKRPNVSKKMHIY